MVKKHVEVVKSMFMVYKVFYCVFGEYIGEESEIILFFCLNFACHETMIKTQVHFLSASHKMNCITTECDGPRKSTTIWGWLHISCNQQSYLPSFIFNCSRFLIIKQSNIISHESDYFQNNSLLYNQMSFIQIIEEMALIRIKDTLDDWIGSLSFVGSQVKFTNVRIIFEIKHRLIHQASHYKSNFDKSTGKNCISDTWFHRQFSYSHDISTAYFVATNHYHHVATNLNVATRRPVGKHCNQHAFILRFHYTG